MLCVVKMRDIVVLMVTHAVAVKIFAFKVNAVFPFSNKKCPPLSRIKFPSHPREETVTTQSCVKDRSLDARTVARVVTSPKILMVAVLYSKLSVVQIWNTAAPMVSSVRSQDTVRKKKRRHLQHHTSLLALPMSFLTTNSYVRTKNRNVSKGRHVASWKLMGTDAVLLQMLCVVMIRSIAVLMVIVAGVEVVTDNRKPSERSRNWILWRRRWCVQMVYQNAIRDRRVVRLEVVVMDVVRYLMLCVVMIRNIAVPRDSSAVKKDIVCLVLYESELSQPLPL
jgi:hypothetical protein